MQLASSTANLTRIIFPPIDVAGVRLCPILPISRPSTSMRKRQHKRPRRLDTVDQAEGKLMKGVGESKRNKLANAQAHLPLFGSLAKSGVKFLGRCGVSVAIPSQRVQAIFFRTGVKFERLGLH